MRALFLQNHIRKLESSTSGTMCFIGAGTIVLCNTRIGDNVVIGANSVVTHNLAANGVYAGNPAKFICSFDDYKAKHERALKTHRYFTERWWYDWKNATPTEWETMREQLSDTWGYVGEKLP